LPAGPLREPASRERDATLFTEAVNEKTADQIDGISDQYFMGRRAFSLTPHLENAYQLVNPSAVQTLAEIAQTYLPNKITAVAALGNPQRFFTALQNEGVVGKTIALPD
ncbi:tetraacyldisaccharide 4'-kinase, partial [Salmonella enterica]|uniref:tetraacyldisaccharide 4'-kinase n=1 Tax=Salmonella enterica TaxID=28901 RepID=UPI003525823D